MPTTTLSSKFKVIIPKTVREALKLKPGIILNVAARDGRIEIVPLRRSKKIRGLLRGIDTSVPREKDRL